MWCNIAQVEFNYSSASEMIAVNVNPESSFMAEDTFFGGFVSKVCMASSCHYLLLIGMVGPDLVCPVVEHNIRRRLPVHLSCVIQTAGCCVELVRGGGGDLATRSPCPNNFTCLISVLRLLFYFRV